MIEKFRIYLRALEDFRAPTRDQASGGPRSFDELPLIEKGPSEASQERARDLTHFGFLQANHRVPERGDNMSDQTAFRGIVQPPDIPATDVKH